MDHVWTLEDSKRTSRREHMCRAESNEIEINAKAEARINSGEIEVSVAYHIVHDIHHLDLW